MAWPFCMFSHTGCTVITPSSFSTSSAMSCTIPRFSVALRFTSFARQVSNPILWVNSLQKMPVALKSLNTFFHCSSSGYNSITLPVVRWLFLLQCGRALYFVNSLSSMVLWYSSIPNAPGRNGICGQNREPRVGGFFWDDPDQDQWSKITRILVHQRNRGIHSGYGFRGSFDALR